MKGIGRYKGYRLADLRKDLISGLIVGIIAILLAWHLPLPLELSRNMACTLPLLQES